MSLCDVVADDLWSGYRVCRPYPNGDTASLAIVAQTVNLGIYYFPHSDDGKMTHLIRKRLSGKSFKLMILFLD
jgi:hypothetical protein